VSFVERRINTSFSIGGSGSGVALTNKTFSGLRTSARIAAAGSVDLRATVEIYGMSLSEMNALAVIPLQPTKVGQNTIRIEAGDAENGMSVVFEGTIIQAWPDMQNAPEVPFRVDAVAGAYQAVKPVDPSSYSGPTDVAQVASQLAGKMGYTFENNGVNLKIDSPYFWGSGLHQMIQLGEATRMGWVQENNVLAIWPQGGARTSAGTTNISKETGMVGYPLATPSGILVKTLFNRAIKYGGQMNVKSDIQRASGTWTIWRVDYDLDAMVPHGKWFTSLYGHPVGQSAPIAQ